YIAACNGTTAGGGYELALACKEIYLQDDGNSAVSLPEVPLLGVLPGTGGLTRLVDKRKIRRDRADVFSTTAEGIRGKRAVAWNLVDGIYPRSKFNDAITARAKKLAEEASAHLLPGTRTGVTLKPLAPEVGSNFRQYRHVRFEWDADQRLARLTIQAPSADDVAHLKQGADAVHAAGDDLWALRAYRELDDALLHLRVNHLGIGLVLVRVEGDAQTILDHDAALQDIKDHWFTHEVLLHMGRVLRRFDLTSRSFFAIGDAGTAFAGNLLELSLASDRFYLLDDPDNVVHVGLSAFNDGALPMSHGISRLEARFIGTPELRDALHGKHALFDPEEAD
ncbi:MAG: enoyl-CoA hydratase/isomerase family protein, partial [Nannocystaceae bacterium]